MKYSVKGEYEEFAGSVDLDGIARTVDSKNFVERLLWVLILVVSFIFSVHFTLAFVTSYTSSSPFITNYDIQVVLLFNRFRGVQ
jgi:hypothetical protein